MADWRIGYLIGPRHFTTDALRMHQRVMVCPNSFVQVGALEALTSPQNCVREMVAEFDRRRRLLMSYLDEIGLSYV